MHYVGRRHYLADASPLRSMPFLRPLSPALSCSPRMKAEAEMRIAQAALAAATAGYQAACAALGVANRRPIHWKNADTGCRAYHQGVALRAINLRRAELRAAQGAVAAQMAVMAALTAQDDLRPVDRAALPMLASMPAALLAPAAPAALRLAA
jgi:hypothetical protein